MTSRLQARLLAQRSLFQRLQSSKKRGKLQAGFTLIELLIVVIIIGILASIALPAFLNQRDRAEIEGVKSEARSFVNGCLASDVTDDPDPTAPYSGWTCPTPPTTATFNNGKATATIVLGSGGSITSVSAAMN